MRALRTITYGLILQFFRTNDREESSGIGNYPATNRGMARTALESVQRDATDAVFSPFTSSRHAA
jgi:hypothetical protein